jgi:two-component system cell cycle sensor histidine kinase PleC
MCPGVCHVGVFAVEDVSGIVVLKGVASEARDELVARRVRVPVGSRSPVGLAVATKQPQAVQNVKVAATHLKPPLLIDTYSAVAMPLLVGDRLIGVLDVQSKRPEAFPSDARQLLTTLANLIAPAVHNAQQYEQQCRTAEHLTEAYQLKTQFLTMISHKLRAPLKTITALSGSFLEGRAGLPIDQQEPGVGLIHSLGQHLLDLTDDFLDISTMKAGAVTLTLEDVDLRLLIESSLDALAPLIESGPITLQAEIAPDVPVVRADKRRVRQVMLNLLSSAAAFSESGRLSVRARTIEALNVDSGRMEPFVEVRVGSNGLKVPKERRTEGLRVVGRLDGPPVSERATAGLGLPAIETLIDLHGGRIWTDSEPGAGTAFTFVLPVGHVGGGKNGPSGEASMGEIEVATRGRAQRIDEACTDA